MEATKNRKKRKRAASGSGGSESSDPEPSQSSQSFGADAVSESSDAPDEKGDDFYLPLAAKFWDTDDQGDWFIVRWVDFTEKTFQLKRNFPPCYWPLLNRICGKYVSARNKGWVFFGGDATAQEKNPHGRCDTPCEKIRNFCVGEHSHQYDCVPLSMPGIVYHSVDSMCLPFSVLNLLQPSRRQATTFLRRMGRKNTIHDLSLLSRATRDVFHLSLKKMSLSLSQLLEEKSGRFIVLQDLHCISIDINSMLFYDSQFKTALPFNQSSLVRAGFDITKPAKISQLVS